MAFNETINTGTTPGDGQGDGLRTNMRKLIENDNYLKINIEDLKDEFDGTFKDNLIYDVGGSGSNYFKVLKLNGDTNISYTKRLVLLIPIVSANIVITNKITGQIIFSRNGGNMIDVVNIQAQSVYSNTFASFQSAGQVTGHKLVTCTYQGVNWLAFEPKYQTNNYSNYWFKGFHVTTPTLDPNNDSLKVINYYDTQNSTVLNSEIYNSIQDYTSTTHFQFSSRVKVDKDLECTTLIQTSDKRFKTNIEPIEGEWALEIFKKLNFSFYDFSKTNSKQAGLIAQEVEKILPQAVHTSDSGEKGLNHTYIDMVCKAAIQHFIKTQIQ